MDGLKKAIGWCFLLGLIVLTLGGTYFLGKGLWGLYGSPTEVPFACDRTRQECIAHPDRLSTSTVRLGDIVGVKLVSESFGLGRRNGSETRYGVELVLTEGTRPLHEKTAEDPDQFRTAAAQIRTFLGGTEPTLSLVFHLRDSHGASLLYVQEGAIGLSPAALLIVLSLLGRSKRRARANDDVSS